MNDYILLMHSDATEQISDAAWRPYFERLRQIGAFEGGSSIGAGEVMRRGGAVPPASDHVSGFVRVRAESLAAAKSLVAGNPVYEAGGSVEVRELPKD
jgi:hypothetical protein